MSDNSTKLDIAPLTIVVTDALDNRVRRQLEAEQQADVKTYEELTKEMQMREDLSKIKDEVENENKDDTDPFENPESTEQPPQDPVENPTPAQNPSDDGQQQQQEQQPPATNNDQQQPEQQADTGNQNQEQQPPAEGGDEDLSSAFENHGMNLPKDLVKRVVKDYIKMESSETESVGELDHIKTFVYIDLSNNGVDGETMESVQTLRDPENTIVVINESSSPDADTTLKARSVAQQLTNRGVKVFYNLDEAINYLNDLYDVITGRVKGNDE